jgi:ribonuclease R
VAESIPVTPQMYQRLTAKIAGKPEERILAYLMLRSLKQARYSEKNVGHFALASAELHALYFADSAVSGPDCASAAAGPARCGREPEGAAILSDAPQPWSESAEADDAGRTGLRRR